MSLYYFNSGPSSIGIGNGGLALNAAAGAGGLAGDLAAQILGTNAVGGAVGGLSSIFILEIIYCLVQRAKTSVILRVMLGRRKRTNPA